MGALPNAAGMGYAMDPYMYVEVLLMDAQQPLVGCRAQMLRACVCARMHVQICTWRARMNSAIGWHSLKEQP